MRHLDINETQQIAGGFLMEAAIATAIVGGSTAVVGWKPVAMAPVALSIAAGATMLTTIFCIPVGIARGEGFTGKVVEAGKYWSLGIQAGWALESQAFG